MDLDLAEFEGVLNTVDYCMVRASYGCQDGTIFPDPKLSLFYAELEQHPHIIRDFYHYISSHSSWTKQYEIFMKAIDGLKFEWLTLDGEKIYNVKSAGFAGSAYYFMKQLIKDFPDKRIKFYSNRYDYTDWFDAYYDFDQFEYHHAQYPWDRWDNVSPLYLPRFLQNLKDIFGGKWTPSLPPSRKTYTMWQVGANTGIGQELGFGADYLDVNVSRMPLLEFRVYSHLETRWAGGIPKPPLTVEERLTLLEKAVFGS